MTEMEDSHFWRGERVSCVDFSELEQRTARPGKRSNSGSRSMFKIALRQKGEPSFRHAAHLSGALHVSTCDQTLPAATDNVILLSGAVTTRGVE